MKPVVLLLSTYPFVEPRHGGQVRLANIAKAYEANGWTVKSIAVYRFGEYTVRQCGKDDLLLPGVSPYFNFKGRSMPFISDLTAGYFAGADDGGFGKIKENLPMHIDAIHVEQPWLWSVAEKIKLMWRHRNCMLIYGAQNIESYLKKDTFESNGINDAEAVVLEVKSLERSAVLGADLTIAVTLGELEVFKSWGGRNVILAQNGISESPAAMIPAERLQLPQEPWLLYIGSAHPPNYSGFLECVGDALGYLSPMTKLVVAGAVCRPLKERFLESRWGALSLSRIQFLGVLSEQDLSFIKALAHGYILPVLHGGGSNIKTAEALYSGKYVVGSPDAFRGFEDYTHLTEVSVATNVTEFQAAINKILSMKPILNTGERRTELLWEYRLSEISKSALGLLNRRENV